jgi:hypothetical protein
MHKTLLTPKEIVRFTRIADTFPLCDLQTIFKIEIKEFRECLGVDFYEYLKVNVVKYDYTSYEKNKTYNIGEYVVHNGIIYQAIVQTSSIPTTITDWTLAPKFNSECLEYLWCNYLGELLAWSVLKNRLPYISTKIEGKGLLKKFDDYSRPAEYEDLKILNYSIDRDIAITFENLDAYIKANPNCYLLYKNLDKHACCGCGCIKKEYTHLYLNGMLYCEDAAYVTCNCDNDNCIGIKKRKNRYLAA